MIRTVEYFMRGNLMESNLDEIEMRTVTNAVRAVTNYAKNTDMDFNPNKEGAFSLFQEIEREIFHARTVALNDKNIEFENTFLVSEYPESGLDEYRWALKKLHLGDIIITLTVYRVGQYSYYIAKALVCREDLIS